MANNTRKISELSSKGIVPESALLPVAVAGAEKETYRTTLNNLRANLLFENAYETLAEGIAATVKDEIFYVYTDDSQFYVAAFTNVNGASATAVYKDNTPVIYGTGKMMADGKFGSYTSYVSYLYNNGSANGGEKEIALPFDCFDVSEMFLNGSHQFKGLNYTFDRLSNKVKLKGALTAGAFVVFYVRPYPGTPITPVEPGITDYVNVTWLYNDGAAVGGETSLTPPWTFKTIPAIYINGSRQVLNKHYEVDSTGLKINLSKALKTNDVVEVILGGSRSQLVAEINGTSIEVFDKLAQPSGANLISASQSLIYGTGSIGDLIFTLQGADKTGIINSLDAFNNSIKKIALKGGGVLKPEPGKYKISGGSILLPSYVNLDLRGVTLIGDGTNTIISSGYIDAQSNLIDFTNEYGTGNTGNGTHYVWNASIFGGTLTNAMLGIRIHRWNFGCFVKNVYFHESVNQSLLSSHSWGLTLSRNTFWAPVVMKDFVDWSNVTDNNFEGNASPTGSYAENYAALTITTGGYGGSYSLQIERNGFHHVRTAISVTTESRNIVIQSNHFESTINHIVTSSLHCSNWTIKNNWFKANLGNNAGTTVVTSMNFGFLANSIIGPNTFNNDGVSSFDYYIKGTSSNVYGNKIFIGYKTDSDKDFSKYLLNTPNMLEVLRGGNDNRYSQPEIEMISGDGLYTFEKYKSNYHNVSNQIRGCSIDYTGTTVTIKTWIPWDNGCQSLCGFNILVFGSSKTIRYSGTFCVKTIVVTSNTEIYGGSQTVTGTISQSADGFVQLVIASAPSAGGVSGWIKEL